MTLQELQALTLDDIFVFILKKILDVDTIDYLIDDFDPENPESMYNRFHLLTEDLTMPLYGDMLAYFESYKANLIEEEEIRLENLRIEDLRNRFKTLKDKDAGYPWFYRLYSDISNAEKYIKDAINDLDHKVEAENLMLALEAESIIIDAENVINEQEKEERKQEIKDLKRDINQIDDETISPLLKKLLKRLVKELR